MSAADERAKAMHLAPLDFSKALQSARRVSDPWYRCQALAAVAKYAPDSEIDRIADESVAAARLGKDVYQRVAVSAWPIRVLAERRKIQHAQRILMWALNEADYDSHPVSRMDALVKLWGASCLLPPTVRQQALTALLDTCRVANSWKAGRTMRHVALEVASENRLYAQQIIHSMRESVYKRQAQREFDASA